MNIDNVHPETAALHLRIETSDALPLVTPIFQNSAFLADSPYFYTRKNNPNVKELEHVLCALEGAANAVAFSTGMAAISAVVDILRPGDTVVVNKDIYGCSFKFFQRISIKRDIHILPIDLSVPDNWAELPTETRMVFLETPTNPFLKTISIANLRAAIDRISPKALIVVDNTWATPLLQQPLKHGADISLMSATKYISGHSDVMGGAVLVNDSALAEDLRASRFYGGAILDPHSAWLLRRSVQTLPIRIREHIRVTTEMRKFLTERSEIGRVYFPVVDGSQLLDYGGILFFEFHPDFADGYTAFRDSLSLFKTGTGMACVTSMVAQPYTGSHASMTPEEKAEIGLTENFVRLCFGLEDPRDLKMDLERALDRVRHFKLNNSSQFMFERAIESPAPR